jgi:hypothetical protein
MTDEALRRADQLLTELVELVETARAVPMSASCVVPREHILDLLDDLREVLPVEMDEARRIAADRDAVVAEASAHAERIRGEADRSMSEARADVDGEVQALLTEAREQASGLREDADRYLREVHDSAHTEARELIEGGRAEHLRLVSVTGVHQAAVSIAERLRREADEYAASTRAAADRYAAAVQDDAERSAIARRDDADGYAERTLADLGEVLKRAVSTTEHGREELVRRRELATGAR